MRVFTLGLLLAINPAVAQLDGAGKKHKQVGVVAVRLYGLQVCAAGGLRGLKDTKIPMIYTVIAYWAVGMTLAYYLTFTKEMGPAGMWIGMIAGLSVAAVLLGVRFWRSSNSLVMNGRQ